MNQNTPVVMAKYMSGTHQQETPVLNIIGTLGELAQSLVHQEDSRAHEILGWLRHGQALAADCAYVLGQNDIPPTLAYTLTPVPSGKLRLDPVNGGTAMYVSPDDLAQPYGGL